MATRDGSVNRVLIFLCDAVQTAIIRELSEAAKCATGGIGSPFGLQALGGPPAPVSSSSSSSSSSSDATVSSAFAAAMKLLPIPLSPLNAPPPLGLWNSELLWRYPPAPPSPLADLKTQLPPQLNTDPRIWGRDEVVVFLRFCEREFDLPKFDLDLFQMNGKALCVLTKNDLAERSPGAGDVLHNVLQMLIRDAQTLHRHLPSSPVTPTGRYPLSPHSHPPTPNWSALAPPDSPFFHSSHLQQFMAASNSVTLSPAPSIDSQAGSPPSQSHGEQNPQQSPPLTPISKETQHLGQLQLLDTKTLQYPSPSSSVNGGSSSGRDGSQQDRGSSAAAAAVAAAVLSLKGAASALAGSPPASNGAGSPGPTTPGGGGSASGGAFLPVKREFFPDNPEPNTNGRLLWDFLQQLLNDPSQRYGGYIAWKCRDTGVFKIVDPAGLAKLWGKQKNHLSMNYDKMSRALRYYYRVNILRKVQGERHCYQFLRNPTELKSIKNISLLRQTMAASQAAAAAAAAAAAGSNNGGGSGNGSNGNSAGNASNGAASSLMSLLPNGANIHHLAAAAAAAAAASQAAGGPLSPSASSSASSSPSALHHHHHQQHQQQQQQQQALHSHHHRNIKMETDLDDLKPTDLSTNDRKFTYSAADSSASQQQQQQHHHMHIKSDDDSMMPTDLSKSEPMYYK
uniref:ETS domain-containing protein n=1 Tax=Anopheles albimanus TaxID=7167 RepID=A0A182F1U2_ANOAL